METEIKKKVSSKKIRDSEKFTFQAVQTGLELQPDQAACI